MACWIFLKRAIPLLVLQEFVKRCAYCLAPKVSLEEKKAHRKKSVFKTAKTTDSDLNKTAEQLLVQCTSEVLKDMKTLDVLRESMI